MVTGQLVVAASMSSTIALPAVVDLDALDPVRDRLLDAFATGSVTLDAGAVERVSTNALFLLLSAAETARRAGTGFAVAAPSPPLLAAIARLGLDTHFADLLEG
jgi:anti-anti-sigma regulatory factor